VPSDLQWLCKVSAEIIEQLQKENEKLTAAIKTTVDLLSKGG